MSPRASKSETAARRARLANLLGVYGALLTEKQRQMAAAHACESLSFAEIARRDNVSRQAVHDAVRHAERLLEEYEATLGVMERLSPPAGDDPSTLVAERLANLRHRVARQGIIYSSDWIQTELMEIERLLEPRVAAPALVD